MRRTKHPAPAPAPAALTITPGQQVTLELWLAAARRHLREIDRLEKLMTQALAPHTDCQDIDMLVVEAIFNAPDLTLAELLDELGVRVATEPAATKA